MKVLVYNNKEKDADGCCKKELIARLTENQIEYLLLEDEMLNDNISADALFAIGGDGTILFLAEFASRNSIPIIGINAGKLGFLCEFEKNDIESAILGLKNAEFINDERTMLLVRTNKGSYHALNEVYVQRTYDCCWNANWNW